jgi:hypothetical protein
MPHVPFEDAGEAICDRVRRRLERLEFIERFRGWDALTGEV